MVEGEAVAGEDVGRNMAMAKWGGEWLVGEVKKAGGEGKGLNVMTVCNTGSLATSVSFYFLSFYFSRCVVCSDLDITSLFYNGKEGW